MSKDQLRFPSGRSVRKIKQDVKKVKPNFSNNTEALNALAKQHGIDMPWDKAIEYMADFWDSWFAVDIYQEEAEWQIDVRHKRFKIKEDAELYSKLFSGKLKWIGGDTPLVLINNNTGETTQLNNADVRLWRTKAESRNKIAISLEDMERVYKPICDWPELFKNENPTFGSLASGVEFGDDEGMPKESFVDKDLEGSSELERLGIKFRASQANKEIIQISHAYDVLKTKYYILTSHSVDEIKSIIATLFDLCEYNSFLPSYYSGGIPLTAFFVAEVLEHCFNQTVITAQHFDYMTSIDNDIDIDVTGIGIFNIEDGFSPSKYDIITFRDVLVENQNTVLSAYRRSLGLPPVFDEKKWMLVNTNPSATERAAIPLSVNGLKVNEAWAKRHELEELIFHAIGKEEGLSRDDDFSEIYGMYKHIEEDETAHDYPVYRVRHKEFNFNAT